MTFPLRNSNIQPINSRSEVVILVLLSLGRGRTILVDLDKHSTRKAVGFTTEEELSQELELRKKRYRFKPGKAVWQCPNCQAQVKDTRVAHSIWDGPFAQFGFGRCVYQEVPYCTNCDLLPDQAGIPIAPAGSYHNPYLIEDEEYIFVQGVLAKK